MKVVLRGEEIHKRPFSDTVTGTNVVTIEFESGILGLDDMLDAYKSFLLALGYVIDGDLQVVKDFDENE